MSIVIDWDWTILICSIIFLVVGLILSEPTTLGRWHPLIGDSMILASIWYIGVGRRD